MPCAWTTSWRISLDVVRGRGEHRAASLHGWALVTKRCNWSVGRPEVREVFQDCCSGPISCREFYGGDRLAPELPFRSSSEDFSTSNKRDNR
jgi:hypothetical protein